MRAPRGTRAIVRELTDYSSTFFLHCVCIVATLSQQCLNVTVSDFECGG